MNKTELIAAVAEAAGVSKKGAEQVLNAFVLSLQEGLKRDGKVQLPGFGTFEIRERAARIGRNPSTGVVIEIPAGKVPAFKPGKAFRDTVQ